MTGEKTLSWAAIAQDACGPRLRHEMRSGWSIAALSRPASVPATWVCARLGLSPTRVTMIGLGLALLIPVQALFLPLAMAPVMIALSGWLFQVLDCTDGTLARVTDTQSLRGGDLDFLVDMTQWGLLYLALGILADRILGGGWGWTALAGFAAWGRLLARVIRDRLYEGDDVEVKKLQRHEYPVAFLAGLSGLIPFFALLGPWLGAAILFLILYSLLDIAEAALPLTRADP